MNVPDLLRAYLADRDVSCPMCGYNLRGLTSARCPECGEAIELRVGLAEPKMGAWIGGLIGLSAGLGFCLFSLLLVALFTNMTPREFLSDFGPGLGGGLLQGLFLYVWVRQVSWIRRRSAKRRWTAAIGCWAFTVLVVTLFVYAAS